MRILALAFIVITSGCASMPPSPPPGSPVQQCCVCKHRRDFACLNVRVTPATPRAVYEGRPYYFCGESCLCEFQKNARRFVPDAGR